jgi:hypothetical protein
MATPTSTDRAERRTAYVLKRREGLLRAIRKEVGRVRKIIQGGSAKKSTDSKS